MTPLAPPTEAEVKELREALEKVAKSYGVECSYAHGVECRGNNRLREEVRAALPRFRALCDAYLAQREAAQAVVETHYETAGLDVLGKQRLWDALEGLRASLSAAPLEDKT